MITKIINLTKQARYMRVAILLLFVIVASHSIVWAQQETSTKRGFQSGAAYSISDIENINNTNGNVMFNIPMASLPAGRGGLNYSISLNYNSKLWDMKQELSFYEQPPGETAYAVMMSKSDAGGWRYGYRYRFAQKVRPGVLPDICDSSNRGVAIYKFEMLFPDGSTHEFKPSQYRYPVQYGPDSYYAVDINGVHRNTIQSSGGCYLSDPEYTGGMYFHTEDGSNLKLIVVHDNDADWTNNHWVMIMPDGSRVTGNEPVGNGVIADQRIYDRNDNFIEITDNLGGVTQVSDQLGRSLTISRNEQTSEDTITSTGFNNAVLTWKVKWKKIGVSRKARFDLEEWSNSFPQPAPVQGIFNLVDEITLPSQLGEQKYKFEYNGNPNGDISTDSYGFGEVKQIIVPSGAKAVYDYDLDGMQTTVTTWQTVKHNPVKLKTLSYQTIYDGVPENITEQWNYQIGRSNSTITGPNGGITKFGYSDIYEGESGLVAYIENPDGSFTKKQYIQNSGSISAMWNIAWEQLVNAEYTTLTDASGNPTDTAVKAYKYDVNGNVIQITEYDWVAYSSLSYQNGQLILPASNKIKRVTKNNYYNAVPEIVVNPTQIYSNEYRDLNSPVLLHLIKSTEVQDTNGVPASRTEFYYDNSPVPTKGNLTEMRTWDSTKQATLQAADSNGYKLLSGNYVGSTVAYDGYGNPTLTTDAKGVTSTITYGAVNGYTGLYPTQTETASNYAALKRTSTIAYDFYTGLATSATDVDNNLTNATEYDALGRPLKAKAAVGTTGEIWTQTEYDDVLRRVIARSDLFIKGDGKKIGIQHYDQLGRVRLTRSIENVLTENPYNEADGIKVQTRYQTGNPYSYQLSSNPYRAATSGAATSEPSMGWTRSKSINTGKHSEVETFSGATLPAPWGSNAA